MRLTTLGDEASSRDDAAVGQSPLQRLRPVACCLLLSFGAQHVLAPALEDALILNAGIDADELTSQFLGGKKRRARAYTSSQKQKKKHDSVSAQHRAISVGAQHRPLSLRRARTCIAVQNDSVAVGGGREDAVLSQLEGKGLLIRHGKNSEVSTA